MSVAGEIFTTAPLLLTPGHDVERVDDRFAPAPRVAASAIDLPIVVEPPDSELRRASI